MMLRAGHRPFVQTLHLFQASVPRRSPLPHIGNAVH